MRGDLLMAIINRRNYYYKQQLGFYVFKKSLETSLQLDHKDISSGKHGCSHQLMLASLVSKLQSTDCMGEIETKAYFSFSWMICFI